ncbi:MAG: protein kinase [Candidatus Aminicenantes bacterium]|nr:protein kinase [Candidatus Aminicenantes bacterium]
MKKSKDDYESRLETSLRQLGLKIKENKKKEQAKSIEDQKEAVKADDKNKEILPKKPISRIGDFYLIDRIGSGGMGEVYKATRRGLAGFEKTVALKRIHPFLAENNEKIVSMFIHEALLAAQLYHPNIVQIYDLGKTDGYYYIVMEYIPGKNLAAILMDLSNKNRLMPLSITTLIGINICHALIFAHRKHDSEGRPLRIVHRDVSPRNILISFGGEVKLADFGVAKATTKLHLTRPGSLKGQVPYMSPQQALGESIDHRSDVYSLGLVLFEMATGRKYYTAENEMILLDKVREGEIVAPSKVNPEIPGEYENIILRCLQFHPDDRYQDANELRLDLEGIFQNLEDRFPSPSDLANFMYELFPEDSSKTDFLYVSQNLPHKDRKLQSENIIRIPDTKTDTWLDKKKKKQGDSYKLIIADDNLIIQKVVEITFNKEGFEVFPVSTGDKLKDFIQKINPDVLLIDVNLPGKDGYEICEYIQSETKLSHIPVIFLKEIFEKINAEKISKLRSYNFVQKPFNSHDLVEKVKSLVM